MCGVTLQLTVHKIASRGRSGLIKRCTDVKRKPKVSLGSVQSCSLFGFASFTAGSQQHLIDEVVACTVDECGILALASDHGFCAGAINHSNSSLLTNCFKGKASRCFIMAVSNRGNTQ